MVRPAARLPAPRPVLLAGLVLSASLRCLLPVTFLLIVGFAVGVHWPGVLGLLIAITLVMGMAVVAATWGTSLALRFRTQAAAPIMQVGMLLAVLLTTAYAPLDLLTGWLQEVAKINPVTQVVEAVRQGFVGSVSWGDTWPGYLTLFGARRGAQLLRPARHAPDDVLMAQLPLVVDAQVRDTVMRIAQQTLDASWIEGERDGVRYAYSRPSPGHYPWQWYWDSCFHADRLAPFRPGPGRAGARSLLDGGDGGRLHRPHDLLGPPRRLEAPLDLQRHLEERAEHLDDPAAAACLGLEDRASATRRTSRGSQPITAGWRPTGTWTGTACSGSSSPMSPGSDSSPKFDPVWGRHAHGHPDVSAPDREEPQASTGTRAGCSPHGGPVLCEVVTNVLWCLARIAAGEPSITPRADRPPLGRAPRALPDTARGKVAKVDDTDPTGGDHRIRVSTWSALAPLALPDLPEEIGKRLVEEHLLDPRKYWLPYPPTSVSAQEPSFEPRRWQRPLRRLYWRGPTWINSAWLIWIGLLRQGYEPEALEMAKRLSEAVVRERLREFYEPPHRRGSRSEGVRLVLADRRARWSQTRARRSRISARRLPLRPSPRCAERRRAPRGR